VSFSIHLKNSPQNPKILKPSVFFAVLRIQLLLLAKQIWVTGHLVGKKWANLKGIIKGTLRQKVRCGSKNV
jgi:hypothetical protein